MFDLAFDLSAFVSHGGMDLTHTGTISFDLPGDVVLTSALGGRFGAAAAVPEPASLALLGLGFAALWLIRRKRAA